MNTLFTISNFVYFTLIKTQVTVTHQSRRVRWNGVAEISLSLCLCRSSCLRLSAFDYVVCPFILSIWPHNLLLPSPLFIFFGWFCSDWWLMSSWRISLVILVDPGTMNISVNFPSGLWHHCVLAIPGFRAFSNNRMHYNLHKCLIQVNCEYPHFFHCFLSSICYTHTHIHHTHTHTHIHIHHNLLQRINSYDTSTVITI